MLNRNTYLVLRELEVLVLDEGECFDNAVLSYSFV